MKVEFKNITNTTIYKSWWKEELEFEDKKGKYGIKVFGKWLLEPIFDKKIVLKDYDDEILLISERYYAYINNHEYNLCVYLSDYKESEYFTFINHSDYREIGFWGVDDTEDLITSFDDYFYVFKHNNLFGYKDFEGNVVIEPNYIDINENYIISPSSYNWLKPYIYKDSSNKWGAVKLINITKKINENTRGIIGYEFEILIDFKYENKEAVLTLL